MIDLMNEEPNKENFIPPPISSDPIIAMLNDIAIYEGEPPIMVLSSLIAEVKMWRSKDEYDKKIKLSMAHAIVKKLEEHGSEMDC